MFRAVIDICVAIKASMPYIWKHRYELLPQLLASFHVVFCIVDLREISLRKVSCALENSLLIGARSPNLILKVGPHDPA